MRATTARSTSGRRLRAVPAARRRRSGSTAARHSSVRSWPAQRAPGGVGDGRVGVVDERDERRQVRLVGQQVHDPRRRAAGARVVGARPCAARPRARRCRRAARPSRPRSRSSAASSASTSAMKVVVGHGRILWRGAEGWRPAERRGRSEVVGLRLGARVAAEGVEGELGRVAAADEDAERAVALGAVGRRVGQRRRRSSSAAVISSSGSWAASAASMCSRSTPSSRSRRAMRSEPQASRRRRSSAKRWA